MSEPINQGDTVKLADPTLGNDTGDEANMAQGSSQSDTGTVAAPDAAPVAPAAPKDPKNWNGYAHLANGDVVKVNGKIRDQISADGNTYRKDGTEVAVIGIYPREVEYSEPEADDE
jgi:hypothetical protein